MITEPTLQQRPAQPYVALRRQVAPHEIGRELPPLHDEVMRQLAMTLRYYTGKNETPYKCITPLSGVCVNLM